MAVCKTVERSVCLGGSCAAWLPLVVECLSARGFRNIREDGLRLSADYDVSGIGGVVSVSLVPDASSGGTGVSVVVSAAPGRASVLAGEGGASLW